MPDEPLEVICICPTYHARDWPKRSVNALTNCERIRSGKKGPMQTDERERDVVTETERQRWRVGARKIEREREGEKDRKRNREPEKKRDRETMIRREDIGHRDCYFPHAANAW